MFWLVVIGFVSGILGGMGMGGGTLLIPMLVWFMGFAQQQAQLLNLLSFVVMAVFALVVHFKNKLVDVKSGLFCGIAGVVTSVIFSLFVKKIEGGILKILFGIFLILIGIWQLITFIRKQKIKK